jgi:hypothetical protein
MMEPLAKGKNLKMSLKMKGIQSKNEFRRNVIRLINHVLKNQNIWPRERSNEL